MVYKLILEDDSGFMGDPKRGSGMGRPDTLPENKLASPVLHLTKMRMVDSDYDAAGAYWGAGSAKSGSMYAAETDADDPQHPIRIFVRARSRTHAKTLIKHLLPHARFFRCPQDRDDFKAIAWDSGRDDALSGKAQDWPDMETLSDYQSGYQCGQSDRETIR